ncbi:MAG TPA: hypothetical protein PKD85_08790 [Saprospiraceae bacterium]|nr:hypothetical protein [Saprospiraceae bacterium]
MQRSENSNKSLTIESQNEIISLNKNEMLYSDFQIEQLEERLEMDPWICFQFCPNLTCGINCEVNTGDLNCNNNAGICIINTQEP